MMGCQMSETQSTHKLNRKSKAHTVSWNKSLECDVGGLWEVCHSDGLGSQKPRKAAAVWCLHGTGQLENPVEEKNTIPALT